LKAPGDRSNHMTGLDGLKVTFLAATLGQGGAERQLYFITRALKQRGALPRVLCLAQGEFWEKRLLENEIPLTTIGESLNRVQRVRRIVQELRQHPPLILQSQHFHMNLYVTAAARWLRLREVGALRSDAYNEVRSIGGWAGRWSLNKPRFLAANSRAAMDNAIEMGVPSDRLFLLPNVLDTDQFCPPKVRLGKPVKLLWVGRLSQEKRADRFIRLVAATQGRAGEACHGVIAGDGPDRAALEKQAEALGLLPAKIEFRGRVTDMKPVYQECDILLLTSDREGTPNVILEGMSAGLPVVATRVGGVPEIVQEGKAGFLAEPNQEEQLVEALVNLVDNAVLRKDMGQMARANVLSQFSVERLADYLEQLYHRVLS